MLCLLIAHGIFLRQEASQSRACHHEESPTCKDPKTHLVHARSVPVRYSRLAPALSRVCEAVAHRRRVRLKLRLRRSARTCTVPPGQLVSFLTTTTARAVDCLISLISHSGPHLPLVIHTSTALHHHSLWCFATTLPFIVPGPAVTLSGTLRLLTYHSLSPATSTPPTRRRPFILPPLAPGQQPYYTFYLSAWLLDACARHGSHLIPPNHLVFFTAKLRSQLPLLRAFLTTTTTYDKRIQ